MTKLDIFITGVGGQGSLTASNFLGLAAARAGQKVVVGEIHGMAQRGGVVMSTVRMGNVWGPIISAGGADVLLGFEPVETWRAMGVASRRTLVVTNTRPIVPASVSMKGDSYPEPEAVLAKLREISDRVVGLDATAMAAEAGTAQAVNAVLLGVLGGMNVLPFGADLLEQIVVEGVPPKAVDLNRKAYALGLAFGARAA